jgi:hypothetical protein
MKWSAVFAGAILGIGLWILLQTLGVGIGLASVDVDEAGNLRGIGIGTGIWSLIAPLIAMFLGAYLAGRLAGTFSRKVGAMHGSVVWALATLVGLWAMLSLVGAMAHGAMRVGGAAVSAGTSVVSGAASAGASAQPMEALGIDANDLLGPINERLQREGKPPITAKQLNQTVKAVAQRGVREGSLDREMVIDEVVRNTNLSRADAEDVANDVMARVQSAQQRAGQAVDRVQERAEDAARVAADKTGKALLLGGIMMLLSLGAAIAGGALGVPKHAIRDRDRDLDRDLDRTDVPPSTLSGPGTTVVTPGADTRIREP